MNIIIYSKSNYGNVAWYIRDAAIASLISALTGRKTISHTDVVTLTAMGHNVTAWLDGALIDASDAMTGGVTMIN